MISVSHMFEGKIAKGAAIGAALGGVGLGLHGYGTAKEMIADPDNPKFRLDDKARSDIKQLKPEVKGKIAKITGGVMGAGGAALGAGAGAGAGAIAKDIEKKRKK